MIPTFTTQRLILRPVQMADAESYQKNFADYEVIRHLSRMVPWPYPENGVREFLQNIVLPGQGQDRWTWVIALKEAPEEVIGAVDLWREGLPEHRGFWLAHRHWGEGLMTEACAPITAYAFTDLGFKELIFANAVGNKRSRRIKEKTGTELLRTEPGEFVDRQYTEREIWRLNKEAWQSYHP